MSGKSFAVFRLACEVKRRWDARIHNLFEGGERDEVCYRRYRDVANPLQRLCGRNVDFGVIGEVLS